MSYPIQDIFHKYYDATIAQYPVDYANLKS